VFKSQFCFKAYNFGLSLHLFFFLDKTVFPQLARLIGNSIVCHPAIDISVLDVMDHISEQSCDILVDLWSSSLQEELLSTSPEKKYLAFHLALYCLPFLSSKMVNMFELLFLFKLSV